MRQDTSERKSCVLSLQHTYSLYEKNADLRSTQGHSGFWAAVHFHLWFIEQRTIQWQFLSYLDKGDMNTSPCSWYCTTDPPTSETALQQSHNLTTAISPQQSHNLNTAISPQQYHNLGSAISQHHNPATAITLHLSL